MGELGEYWRDVKPHLKELSQEKREQQFDKRIDYAILQFENEKIPYKLCNKSNGHFNLYKDNKVVMSFWSYTGRIYSTLIDIDEDFQRGIKQCLKIYNKNFKL